MTKLLAYDPNTMKFIGWYDDTIHQTLPDHFIQVTDKEYQVYKDQVASNIDIIHRNKKYIVKLDPPKMTWDMIKLMRNDLLADSDWIMVEDSPFSPEKKAEWRTYRQALRDITQNFSSPESVIWPIKPT